MLSEPDLSGLIEDHWTPSHWNLLWLLTAPLFWYLARYIYELYSSQAESGSTERSLAVQLVSQTAPADSSSPSPTPRRVAELMRRYEGRWAIAGGWALELHLGRAIRPHADIEIAVLRGEQRQLWDYLIGWSPLYVDAADGHARKPWLKDQWLEAPLHELSVDPPQADIGRLEILINDSADDRWIYRRDQRLSLPLATALRESADGIPYLAPEIVLLFKSAEPRERDETDFSAVLPELSPASRQWLRQALELLAPEHPWLSSL